MQALVICSLIALIVFGTAFYFIGMPAFMLGILAMPVAVLSSGKKETKTV